MAVQKTPMCDLGAPAPDFSLPDTAGTVHSLRNMMGSNGLLVMFICNHCPYVQAVLENIVCDARELQMHGVRSVAIMSNDVQEYPEDDVVHMRKVAAQYDFPFPYLFDESQKTARDYGAVCTPDFFGYNRQFQLQYRGRLDDTMHNKGGTRQRDLFDALVMIADTEQGPAQQIPSMGCSMKWRQT